MQRIYLLSITFFCSVLLFGQSPTTEQIFMAIPGQYLWLTQADRSNMLINYNENNVDSIKNSFSGTSRIKMLDETNKHLFIETSSKGSFELLRLNNGGQPCYAIIRTACAPACDSRIDCFDLNWNLLDIDPPAINAEDFLIHAVSADDSTLAIKLLTPTFIRMSFNAADGSLLATCDAGQFLSEDDWKKLKPLLLSEPLIFTLQNNKWVKSPR
jgi:hypothetical protein